MLKIYGIAAILKLRLNHIANRKPIPNSAVRKAEIGDENRMGSLDAINGMAKTVPDLN